MEKLFIISRKLIQSLICVNLVLSCNSIKQTSEVNSLVKDKKNNITELENYLKEHPNSTHNIQIEKEITKLFEAVTPPAPICKLNNNLSVDIKINSVPGADSYIIFWTTYESESQYSFKNNTLKTFSLSWEHWPESFPQCYHVIAVRGNVKSKPSKACKVGNQK